MPRKLKLEIANLVVKFEDTNLIDRADDIVLPAFFHNYERKYDRTKYIFHKVNTKLVSWDDGDDIAVYGRFIKDTVLEREQVLIDGEIVKDHSEMESAPSAIFILLLRQHRLLYVKEQSYAPTPKQFGATLKSYIRDLTKQMIQAEYDELYETKNYQSKARIATQYPRPTVEVTPIGSEDNLAEFLERFFRLDEVTFRLNETNAEPDNSAFFQQMRGTKADLGATKAKLTYSKPPSQGGLDVDVAEDQIKASLEGTADVSMRGIDHEGQELKGNAEAFKVSADITAGTTPRNVASKAIDKFKSLVNDGVVKYRKASSSVQRKLDQLAEDWVDDD